MTESQIHRAIDRELSFFLRFYMAYDKPRARKMDEIVTLIGHSRASRLSLRYTELYSKVQEVIEENSEEYSLSEPYVWLNDDLGQLDESESVSRGLQASVVWPSQEYELGEKSFRDACKTAFTKHKLFADDFSTILGLPAANKNESSYKPARDFLLNIPSQATRTKYGLKDENLPQAWVVLEAGTKIYELHLAESIRLAG